MKQRQADRAVELQQMSTNELIDLVLEASAMVLSRVRRSDSPMSPLDFLLRGASRTFADAGDRLRATIWCDGDLFHRLEGSDLFVHVRSKKDSGANDEKP